MQTYSGSAAARALDGLYVKCCTAINSVKIVKGREVEGKEEVRGEREGREEGRGGREKRGREERRKGVRKEREKKS